MREVARLSVGEQRDVYAKEEQYTTASQQNTVLPTITPFYEGSPSVGADERNVQFTATPAVTSILVVDKVWHSSGVLCVVYLTTLPAAQTI
jgi:hypothetical protein